MRIVKILIALPMILLFGILRLFATAISCAVHIIHKLFSGKYAALIISAITSVLTIRSLTMIFLSFPDGTGDAVKL